MTAQRNLWRRGAKMALIFSTWRRRPWLTTPFIRARKRILREGAAYHEDTSVSDNESGIETLWDEEPQ